MPKGIAKNKELKILRIKAALTGSKLSETHKKNISLAQRKVYELKTGKKYEIYYPKYKKLYCEICGFVAAHKSQLDVDHKDGNHNNNSIKNLQTLCANCHRLKTIRSKEHASIKPFSKVNVKGRKAWNKGLSSK